MDADHRSHGETVREPEGSGSEGWQEALRRIAEAKQAESDVLRLDGLGLSSVPWRVGELKHLILLDLDGNRLETIPEVLTQLPRLQGLFLNRNQIREIPLWFSRLSNLQVVALANNRITNLPDLMAQMTNLKLIELRGNPLPEEFAGVASQGAKALRRYLRLAGKEGVNPRTTKVVLLGEPKSGKTTLLEALKGNPKPCDPGRNETLGVNIVTIAVTNPLVQEPLFVSIWDFAGQHIEHATHQFFLTEGATYVILWNARQGIESGKRDLWYWLELLKMRVRDPKFLVVATHTERTPADLNVSDIEETYPGFQGHFPVDLATLKGFEALRGKIVEVAAQSPSLNVKWPAAWLVVRDEIRNIRGTRPLMTPSEFQTLMNEKGLAGQEARDLASQLHNLSEILYFQDRGELSKFVILNVEWAAELIALVVRSDEVRRQGGILTRTDLDRLWEHAHLTPEVQVHLINLMDWFDLTYATGAAQEIGIVVEALPYTRSEALKEVTFPTGRPTIEVIFRFPLLQRRLPPGIPTWAIARAHRFSTHRPWRDAAFFEDKETNSFAEIRASDTKKEVRLRVTADFPAFFFGRLEAILRDTFKRYPGAVPERRLPCNCRAGCPHSYLYEAVRSRAERGEQFVTCEYGANVPIQPLLTGLERPESKPGLFAFWAEMRRHFTVLLSAMREAAEKPCPSVFTLLPSQGFKQLDNWIESFTQTDELELSLYCEDDSGWHTTPHSLYRFRPDQAWFEEVKRRWNRFAGVTKHVAPLAKTVGKAAQIPWMEIGGLGLEKLPETRVSDAAKFAAILGGQAEPGFVDLETRDVLCKLLEYLDAQRSVVEAKNGGLHKFLMDDGRWLWLCPEHVRSYRTRVWRSE